MGSSSGSSIRWTLQKTYHLHIQPFRQRFLQQIHKSQCILSSCHHTALYYCHAELCEHACRILRSSTHTCSCVESNSNQSGNQCPLSNSETSSLISWAYSVQDEHNGIFFWSKVHLSKWLAENVTNWKLHLPLSVEIGRWCLCTKNYRYDHRITNCFFAVKYSKLRVTWKIDFRFNSSTYQRRLDEQRVSVEASN